MSDGCLALTHSNGNAEIIIYIAGRIANRKLYYNQKGNYTLYLSIHLRKGTF